jgi:7,8-dihydro-6-hydroxymethylpterin-pyrophosphokinase
MRTKQQGDFVMAVVSVQTHLTTQQLLDAIGQLDAVELEKVARHVSRLRTRRKAGTSTREAELLKAARRRLPHAFLRRYRELIAKRQAVTLTEAEYQELLQMGEEAEAFNVQRITALAELAQLRQTDLDALMHELDIKPARHA